MVSLLPCQSAQPLAQQKPHRIGRGLLSIGLLTASSSSKISLNISLTSASTSLLIAGLAPSFGGAGLPGFCPTRQCFVDLIIRGGMSNVMAECDLCYAPIIASFDFGFNPFMARDARDSHRHWPSLSQREAVTMDGFAALCHARRRAKHRTARPARLEIATTTLGRAAGQGPELLLKERVEVRFEILAIPRRPPLTLPPGPPRPVGQDRLARPSWPPGRGARAGSPLRGEGNAALLPASGRGRGEVCPKSGHTRSDQEA
jgi:hypothetical protein